MSAGYYVGILALIVFFYRVIVLMIPMMLKGLRSGDTKKLFDSFTLLV